MATLAQFHCCASSAVAGRMLTSQLPSLTGATSRVSNGPSSLPGAERCERRTQGLTLFSYSAANDRIAARCRSSRSSVSACSRRASLASIDSPRRCASAVSRPSGCWSRRPSAIARSSRRRSSVGPASAIANSDNRPSAGSGLSRRMRMPSTSRLQCFHSSRACPTSRSARCAVARRKRATASICWRSGRRSSSDDQALSSFASVCSRTRIASACWPRLRWWSARCISPRSGLSALRNSSLASGRLIGNSGKAGQITVAKSSSSTMPRRAANRSSAANVIVVRTTPCCASQRLLSSSRAGTCRSICWSTAWRAAARNWRASPARACWAVALVRCSSFQPRAARNASGTR